MRTLMLALVAAALGVSSAFLVACGDRNDLIPPGNADAIQADLDRAETNFGKEECRAAEADVQRARSRAEKLPGEVDAELRRTLNDNLRHLLSRIQADCGKGRSTQSTQTTATTPTVPTQTTITETTSTETEPPTTETEPPTTETEPPTETDSGGTPPGLGGGSGGSGGESP